MQWMISAEGTARKTFDIIVSTDSVFFKTFYLRGSSRFAAPLDTPLPAVY